MGVAVAAVLVVTGCSSGGDDGADDGGRRSGDSGAATTTTAVAAADALEPLTAPGPGWTVEETARAASPSGTVLEGDDAVTVERTVRFEQAGEDRLASDVVRREGEPDQTVDIAHVGDRSVVRFSGSDTVVDGAEGIWLDDPEGILWSEPGNDPEAEASSAGSPLGALLGPVSETGVADLADLADVSAAGDTVEVAIPASPFLAYYGGWVADLDLTATLASDTVESVTFRGLTVVAGVGLAVVEGTVTPAREEPEITAPTATRAAVPEDLESGGFRPFTAATAPLSELDLEGPDPYRAFAPGTCVRLDAEADALVRSRIHQPAPCSDENPEIVGLVPIEAPTPQRPRSEHARIYAQEVDECGAAAARHAGDPTGSFLPRRLGYSVYVPDLGTYARGEPALLCVITGPGRTESVAGVWADDRADALTICFDYSREDRAVSCTEPHDGEEFARVDMRDAPDDLTEEQVLDQQAAACRDLLEEFVGVSLEELVAAGVFHDVPAVRALRWPQDKAAYCTLQTKVKVTGTAYQTDTWLGA